MKRRLNTFIFSVLSLALFLSLAVPALAYEDTDPPQWREWGYESLEELLEDWHFSEDDYYQIAVQPVLNVRAWMDAHPEECASFDPYAYFAAEYAWCDSPQEYMADRDMTEETFRQEMLTNWAQDQLESEAFQAGLEAVIAAHPEEYASFDPYAYFAAEYPWYDSPQEYMAYWDMTEEDFSREMLESWMETLQWRDQVRAQRAQEKTQYGGSPDGVNVMINGTCVPFPDVRPELTNDRTMVPLAAAMEQLGAVVQYQARDNAVLVSMEDRSLSLYHQIGSRELILTSAKPDGSEPEDMSVQTIRMDTPSYEKDGRTMVPLAFFAQVLGFEVFWDEDYETAVLLDRQRAAEDIDRRFTLLNRMLYTLSGAEQQKQGQSLSQSLDMELVVTLLDSLNGDKSYSMSLNGASLTNEKAASAHYTLSLGDLFDLLTDVSSAFGSLDGEARQELEDYRAMLSKVSLDVIVDREGECLYLRSPLLTQLELVENPNAWAALPIGTLAYDTIPLSDQYTVGNLLTAILFTQPYSPFQAWAQLDEAVSQLDAYAGDSQFVRSGASYVLNWAMEAADEVDPYFTLYSTEKAALQLKITPAGDRGCTYAMTMDMNGSGFVLDMDLTGASGRADLALSFHVKNIVKGSLSMAVRTSSTSRQPLTMPPAGDEIEHPAGYLGVGYPQPGSL